MILSQNVRRRPKIAVPITTRLPNRQSTAKEEGVYKPLTIVTTYENHTGREISILERSGLNYTIKPSGLMSREGHGNVRVVKTYRLDNSVNIDEVLLSNDDNSETKNLKEALASRWTRDLSFTEFAVVYSLPLQLFSGLESDIYVRELDIVITSSGLQGLVHPYSREGEISRLGNIKDDSPIPGIGFRWIVSTPMVQTLYANIGGEVICIDAQVDETLDDGFYVFTHGHSLADRKVGTVDRLTVEEAMKKYGLSTNFAEARDNLSADVILQNDLDYSHKQQKLDLMDKEYGLRIKQIEANDQAVNIKLAEIEAKHRSEIEGYKLEAEKRQREHEQMLAKFNLESDRLQRDLSAHIEKIRQDEISTRRKDYYEERHHVRKDSSELVKWAPSLIVGLGLLLPKLIG